MNPGLAHQFADLENLRQQLLEQLRSIDSSKLLVRRQDGGWCALEIMSHLMSAESRSLGYIRKKLGDPSSVPDAGLGSFVRTTLLRLALALPFRYRAPESVAQPECPESLASAASEWERIRSDWRELVESFPPELESKAIFRHPVAGRMNLSETLQFHRSHLTRHRAQIERLIV